MSLLVPYLAACLLLLVAGIAKALDPADTARALSSLVPLRRAEAAVRALAAGEALLGAAGLAWPAAVTALIVAVSYAGFSGFVLFARRRGGPLATCGCFGEPDTPATGLHAGLTAGLAAAAAAVALARPHASPIWQVLSAGRRPLEAVATGLVAAAVAWLAYLAMSPLARLRAGRAR